MGITPSPSPPDHTAQSTVAVNMAAKQVVRRGDVESGGDVSSDDDVREDVESDGGRVFEEEEEDSGIEKDVKDNEKETEIKLEDNETEKAVPEPEIKETSPDQITSLDQEDVPPFPEVDIDGSCSPDESPRSDIIGPDITPRDIVVGSVEGSTPDDKESDENQVDDAPADETDPTPKESDNLETAETDKPTDVCNEAVQPNEISDGSDRSDLTPAKALEAIEDAIAGHSFESEDEEEQQEQTEQEQTEQEQTQQEQTQQEQTS
eukprot:sb/3468393/